MPIRIAILGCGEWGRNHVRVFSELRDSRVVLCVDPGADSLARVRERYPKMRTAGEPEAAFRDSRVDAVVIATPTESHADHVRAALRAGKDVFCEKPLCTRSEEALELDRLARRNKRVLMVGHIFLFNPGIRKLRELLSAGLLGRPYTFHATRTNLGPIRRDVNVVWDLATHDVSIFNWLLGSEPLAVSARGKRYLQEGLEDVALLSFEYPNDVLAGAHVSWIDPKKVREITVVGDRKMAVWNDLSPIEPLRIYDKGVSAERRYETYGEFQHVLRDGDILIPKVPSMEPLKAEALHFLECIRNRAEPISGGTTAIGVVRAAEAANLSIDRGGAPVSISRA